jgi:F-type H+-transporting ATPase subunit delta
MITSSIARRYAKALFGLATERGKVEPWAGSLTALKAAISASSEIRDVLANPVFTREQRLAIVSGLARALSLDAEPANLLNLLAERNRLGYLEAIADVYRGLADESLGRVRARLISAVPLPAATVEGIAVKLAAAARAEVLVDQAVDPALLGGVVAQVGSMVYDGSVRTQLEDLRRSLKR